MVEEFPGDLLQRHRVADVFETASAVARDDDVFLVHGGFGMGKTFFVEKWVESLRNRGKPVILFDAWRHDYVDEPLTAFLSVLNDQYGEDGNGVNSKIRKLAALAAPFAMRAGLRVVTRLLTMGAIDGDVDKVKEVLAAEGLAASSDLSEQAIQAFGNFLSQKATHENLSGSFDDLVQSICKNSESNELVIVVDELDRCKPSFVLELLENIKHFLNVPKVRFFIFCDQEFLHSQAAKIFGEKESGEKYVSKFFTLFLRLPDISRREFAKISFEKNFRTIEHQKVSLVCEDFAIRADKEEISLRQIDRAIRFSYLVSIAEPWLLSIFPITNSLILLREVNSPIYLQIRDGKSVSSTSAGSVGVLHSGQEIDGSIRKILFADPNQDLYKVIGAQPNTDYAVHQLLKDGNLLEMKTVGQARTAIINALEYLGSIV